MKHVKQILAAVLVLALLAALAGCTPVSADASASGDGSASTMGSMFSLIATFGLMIVLFYFLLIRPENKRKKQVNEMRSSLQVGDEITTIGGVVGKIVSIKDDTITLAIGAQRTEMVVARWAIRQVEEVSVENDGEVLA